MLDNGVSGGASVSGDCSEKEYGCDGDTGESGSSSTRGGPKLNDDDGDARSVMSIGRLVNDDDDDGEPVGCSIGDTSDVFNAGNMCCGVGGDDAPCDGVDDDTRRLVADNASVMMDDGRLASNVLMDDVDADAVTTDASVAVAVAVTVVVTVATATTCDAALVLASPLTVTDGAV